MRFIVLLLIVWVTAIYRIKTNKKSQDLLKTNVRLKTGP
jgi:hypothetical protein